MKHRYCESPGPSSRDWPRERLRSSGDKPVKLLIRETTAGADPLAAHSRAKINSLWNVFPATKWLRSGCKLLARRVCGKAYKVN